MSKVQELSREINVLKRQVEIYKDEGIALLKEKDALVLANKNQMARIDELEKKLKEFERLYTK